MAGVKLHGQQASAAELAAGSVDTSELAPGAVTGAKWASTPFVQKLVVGHNNTGACTATGLTVGQRVISVFGYKTDGTGALLEAKASFEATVTVADQLQQSSASDLSGNTYLVTVVAVAA